MGKDQRQTMSDVQFKDKKPAEPAAKSTKRGNAPTTGPKFGTFGGVFTPCTLTILGVIMFLRFGHVVGQAGLLQAILIVCLAKLITLLTTLSLSAIATNTHVKGGGAYFLISRSLGVEYGGAIGLVFFIAQAISVAMYVIGFSEACFAAFPQLQLTPVQLSSIVNTAVFACVMVGAGWTIKLQYGILAVLAAAIASFFLGASSAFSFETLQANLRPSYLEGHSMYTMFALFFPAVTGIMAGANMSGDLRDPAVSIPKGTLWAVFVTAAIYLGMAVALAGASNQAALITNNLIVGTLALSPGFVIAGVFAATLSSALGSMLGAPRILHALAGDEIFAKLKFFARGTGRNREPRRATVLTFLIAEACILLGNLDAIAPVITMAFMITYGTLNLATFYESITNNPSYRPRFRYCNWLTSLSGALGCFSVMFLISWRAAILSLLAMAALHWFIQLRKVKTRWGDVKRGVVFERTRRNLAKLEQAEYHPKNWRPNILAMSGGVWSRKNLAVYGHWLTSGHGVLTLVQVVPGTLQDMAVRREQHIETLRKLINESEIEAFASVVVADELSDAVEWLIQCYGIGGVQPNTVLFGWPTDESRYQAFGELLQKVASLRRSVVAIHCSEENEDPWEPEGGTIDVWWRGEDNGGLMLLLAHLLSQNLVWSNHSIRLLRVIESEAGVEDVTKHLQDLAREARIEVEVKAIVDRDPVAAIHRESAGAGVVFLGLISPAIGTEEVYVRQMQSLAASFPTVVFVNSAGEVSLQS